jgi:transglutaminase-like putative cysteine protease
MKGNRAMKTTVMKKLSGCLVDLRATLLLMRCTAIVVIAGLLGLLIHPEAMAQQIARPVEVRSAPAPKAGKRPAPPQPEMDLSQELNGLQERAQAWANGDAEPAPEELAGVRGQLVRLDKQARQGFDQVSTFIDRHALPLQARLRHADAVAEYSARMASLLAGLDALRGPGLEKAAKPAAYRNLAGLLSEQREAQTWQPLDPGDLPVRPAPAQKRKPAASPEEFQRFLERTGGPKALAAPIVSTNAAAQPPQPADLQANQDAQITPEIQALAASLGGDPLAIYNWVHDNVRFVPTYGSVQGSRMTLEAKSGNAFDTASLLVALLRAANVPARYVIGTVQVPVASVLNWLEGAENAAVAQELLGVGGIPNVGLLQGNQITHLRIEHVWVEAWVDFIPGRGARPGAGDTWLALDAGFKQHDLTPDRGVLAAAPIDLPAVWAEMTAGGKYDPVLERTAGIDTNVMQEALFEYGQSAQTYSNDHGIPSTPEALLGSVAIRPAGGKVLPASLPYEIVSRNAAVATLPAALRPSVTLRGYASVFDRALGDPAYTYQISLPELNSRRLGLTFPPATAADALIIENARQSGATSLPVYLINVTPTVTLDGSPVATAPATRMGSTHFVDVVLRDTDGADTLAYEVPAGDESVFGVNGYGIAENVVAQRLARMPSDNTAENLQQVALHYWMESDFFDSLAAAGLKVHKVRRLSVGRFAAPLTVSYFFGAPRSGVYQSRIMDVKRSLIGVASSDEDRERAFVRTSGMQGSFLEGSVLDQLYQRPLGEGVSAVQLLQDATRAGIPIYHVTQANSAQVLPLLQVPSAVRSDIVNAVNTGKTVLVPERDFRKDNYRGIGYIVEDPATGAAAYLISGGLNGGGLLDCLPDLVPIIIFILVIIIIAILLWYFWPAIVGALAGAGAAVPAFARAIAALIAMLMGTAPAYAAGGLVTGGQADPCNCPPLPPPPPCRVDIVPPSVPHYPCPGSHWHYQVWNQGPPPACTNFPSSWYLGGCIPPPVPVPCPPI